MSQRINYIAVVLVLVFFTYLLTGEPAVAVDYTTPIALPDLATDTYYGEQGGLWPNGQNIPPAAYKAQLDGIAASLANEPQVVTLSLGMSMMQNASNGFMQAGYASGGNVNPAFTFVNGAIGSKQQNWIDPNNSVWNRGITALSQQGLNAAAVDVVIYHNAWAGPSSLPFPDHAVNMKNSIQTVMGIIQDKYPNVQMILVLNRHYALSATSKHPEPYAYEEGFSWKWVVEERINCTVDCGVPIAWMANQWDADWANHPEYYVTDGLHLSPGPGGGQYASADIWYSYMSAISYIAPWYLDGPPPPTNTPGPTATPTIEPTATETMQPTATPIGGTATPSPFPTATTTGEPTVMPTGTPDGSPWYCEIRPDRWPCPDLGW